MGGHSHLHHPSFHEGEYIKELEESQKIAHADDARIGGFLLYSKPNQRQRWGDHQAHPVKNYGDLFFDLFYVAAAYNLGMIIFESPTANGLLYFVACFWAIYLVWWDKLYYDARFFTYDDAFHRVLEISILLALGSAVVHIRPVAILSASEDNSEAFAFALSLAAVTLLSAVRFLEMLIIGCVGQPVAIVVARRDTIIRILPFLFYAAAAIYSGVQYFRNSHEKDGYAKDDDHRVLAAAEGVEYAYQSSGNTTHVSMYLILAGAASWSLGMYSMMCTLPKDHKTVTVPMNVDFSIHRGGEWIMLMLGESVLSLLIVELAPTTDYYVTFYCGILSVTFLHYLHFRSQPAKADDHAMRRSRNSGFAFSFFFQVYSAALIVLGVSYKMLLYDYVYQSHSSERRWLLPLMPRWLAAGGGGALAFDTEDRRQRVAHFFGASMAIVFFCSDAMMLAHRGIKTNMERCRCQKTHKTKLKGIVLVLLRVGIIVFMATLSQYETYPKNLAGIGLGAIIGQVFLRVVSFYVFSDDRVHVSISVSLHERQRASAAEEVSKQGEDDRAGST